MVLILLFAIIGIAPAIAQLKIKCDTNGWNDLAQLRSNQANAMLKCDADSTTLEDLLELNTPNLEQCFCKPAILEGLVKYDYSYIRNLTSWFSLKDLGFLANM